MVGLVAILLRIVASLAQVAIVWVEDSAIALVVAHIVIQTAIIAPAYNVRLSRVDLNLTLLIY